MSAPDCPGDYQATAAQVAADQRRDVAEAVRELGRSATVERVSDTAYLHPAVVVRRLAELGLTIPGMGWRPERKARSESQKAETTKFLDTTGKVRGERRRLPGGN